MPPDVPVIDQQHLLPGNRRIRAGPGQIEFRYEEWGDIYVLRAFTETIETTGQGRIADMGADLKDIITLGRVGGHAWNETTLWFVTDTKFNIIEFISPKEPDRA
jgi:hypothetical protein